MKIHLFIALIVCLGFSLVPSRGTSLANHNFVNPISKTSSGPAPGAGLPRSSPDAQGVSSASVLSFI